MSKPKVKGPNLGRCFRPKRAWLPPKEDRPNGKKKLLFRLPYIAECSPIQRARYEEVSVPCKQCLSCRVTHAASWSYRVMAEARDHAENCWITLTYDNENLPMHGSLSRSDVQKFFKRLRHHLGDKRIRYFGCGEYGENRGRPHYHLCIFGFIPTDWVGDGVSSKGHPIYISPELESIWGKGRVQVAELTPDAAAYTARYSMKKITGKGAEEVNPETGLRPYEKLDPITGEIVEVAKEMMFCSTHPGIGKSFFERFSSELFPSGFAVHKGRKIPVPEYFWKCFREEEPELYDALKEDRAKLAKAAALHPDNSDERLADREKYAEHAYVNSRSRGLVNPLRYANGDPLKSIGRRIDADIRKAESRRLVLP